MPEVITKFFKLIEDHQILTASAQFPTFIENFFNVGFGAGGGDDFVGNICQPFEALFAHSFGQNCNRFTAQKVGVVSTTSAIIAGGGPNCFLGGGVKLAGNQTWSQTTKSRTDFMDTTREPLADQAHNPGIHTGQFFGKLQVVDGSKSAALSDSFIVPGDSKEVEGVQVP